MDKSKQNVQQPKQTRPQENCIKKRWYKPELSELKTDQTEGAFRGNGDGGGFSPS